MSISDRRLSLLGCGIDAEHIARFSGMPGNDPHPFPSVFSAREIAHARGSARPSACLCASWCCKEAVFKALGGPYNWDQCEMFLDKDAPWPGMTLGEEIRREFRVAACSARIAEDVAEPGVMTVSVFLFGEPRP